MSIVKSHVYSWVPCYALKSTTLEAEAGRYQ